MALNRRAARVFCFSILIPLLMLLGSLPVAEAAETVEWPINAEQKPSTVTAADGTFLFEGLAVGTHQVYLDPATLPVDLRPVPGAPAVTLWVDPGQTLVSDLIGGGVRFSATYERDGASIRGVVFWDRDGDGRQGAGEEGLAGVTVIDPTIHQYFVPFDDANLIRMLSDSNVCQGGEVAGLPVGDFLASRISLTASSDRTIYYYDHHEDGYDADPLNPGPTTEVGVLDAGETRIFADDIDTTDLGNPNSLYYDGRDRITVFGEEASVMRGAFPSLTDSLISSRLAGAWEIEQKAECGAAYVIPAGEDWGPGSDFEFTGVSVMALEDGVQVYLDGVLTDTLDMGETLFANGAGDGPGMGGLDSGDTFTTTGPVQVHAFSSICTLGGLPLWSGNGYNLEPQCQWTNDYWSPVPRRTSGPACSYDADMDIFLYNPGLDAQLQVDDGASYTVNLPPGSSSVGDLIAPMLLSDTHGVHLYTPNGEPFWGVVNMDTEDTAFEWGYSLIDANELSSQVVLGWAPGNFAVNPMAQYPPSGNLVWVTPVTDTVVYVDLNQDDNPDLVDCNGDGDAVDTGVDGVCDELNSDLGIPLAAGQTLRLADPFDADMTGALIYTEHLNEKIAVVWGEDPCVAEPGRPYLDMGYTVLPIAIPSLIKYDALAQDVDGSSDISRGDILSYTIVLYNNGMGPMHNVVLTDVLPFTYTEFVVGSLASTPPAPDSEEYYGAGAWGYTPTGSGPYNADPNVEQFRLFWNEIVGQWTVTVTFQMRIRTDVPPDVDQISNLAVVQSDETPPRESEDPQDPIDPSTDTPLGQPILWLDKLPSDPSTVRPGEPLTYTIVVSNVGTANALSALVVEQLPPWLTYVPGTLDLTWPVARVVTSTVTVTQVNVSFNETYGDNFDNFEHTATTVLTGSDGTLNWLSDWYEVNDDDNPALGDVVVVATSVYANSAPSYLFIFDSDDQDSGLGRCADLGGFVEPHLTFQLRSYHADVEANDTYRVTVTSTLSPTSNDLIQEMYNDDNEYVTRDVSLVDYAGHNRVCVTFFGERELDNDPAIPGYEDLLRFDDIFIYEASPARPRGVDEVRTRTVIDYYSVTGTDPVTYTRILPDPTTAAITHTMYFTDAFLFPPQSRMTATFQMMVGLPLTDGLTMINSAFITATNLVSTPYPLQDDEPTPIQSDHVLTITKRDDPGTVYIGQRLTYTLAWAVSGDEPVPGLVVTDTLPLPYVSYRTCAPSPCGETAPGSGVVVWDLGDRLPLMSGITYDSGELTLVTRVEQYPPGGTLTSTVAGVMTNTVIIADEDPNTPPDEDDEPTEVLNAGFVLSKRRFNTPSPVAVGEDVEFLIVITNTGEISITRLPLEDTYDPFYLAYQDAAPAPDDVLPGRLTWDDLAADLPDGVLLPGAVTQVWVQFEALTSTQHLTPPVTLNIAVSDGAETISETLPPVEDEDDVSIEDEEPTAIELLYLRAGPKSGGVLVEWATLFEIDTYGFWLYRAGDVELDGAVPLSFVAGKGAPSLSATYQYLDLNLPSGPYYYWLGEVENGGRETIYGPVSAFSGWTDADRPYRVYLPLVTRQ